MDRFIMAILIILGAMLLWVQVQVAYRRFSKRHPQLGPFRAESEGCGTGSCQCSGSADCASKGSNIRSIQACKTAGDPGAKRSICDA